MSKYSGPNMSRRDLLKRIGAGSALVTVAAAAPTVANAAKQEVRYAMVIDVRRCSGCQACSIACKAEFDVPIGGVRSWVEHHEAGVFPATERRLKRYVRPDLLILDELGYVPCNARAADLLFHIISRRHEQRSVVITTNLAFKQWGSVFQDASCLSALIDRFAQHCHVIDIDAESWRDKSSLRHKRKKSPRRKPSR